MRISGKWKKRLGFGWLGIWLIAVLFAPGIGEAATGGVRVEIGDAGSGTLLGRAPWDAELAGIVTEIARSCHQVDPAAQIRFPPGHIVRTVFPDPAELGMPERVTEIWIAVPRGELSSGRVIAFGGDGRMTVYRPDASLEPLRRWIHRHTGQGGAPVHRSAPASWTRALR